MRFDPAQRPRAHFAPQRNWMNDPNGQIYRSGTYHLFFQCNADGIGPARASWGHATSPDLRSWTELPIAIRATETEYALSGSVVFDAENASGLGTAARPPMVAVFSTMDPVSKIQAQGVAFSLDDGLTWTKYADNPVIDIGSTEFRDPKLLHVDDGWVMVLVMAEDRRVRFYRSRDLLHWEHLSFAGPFGSVDGVWECPDVLLLPIEGTTRRAWVLLLSVQSGGPAGGSGMQYILGDFDGTGFEPSGEARWLDFGSDFYAAVSYTDAPGPEPVIQGWMSNWDYAAATPATTFRGSMTLPRCLSLRERHGRLVVVQRPVVAVGEVLAELADSAVDGRLELPCSEVAVRVVAEIQRGTAERFGLEVRVGSDEATRIVVDPAAGTLALDRTVSGYSRFHDGFAAVHTAPLPDTDVVRLEVYVDVASVEVLAADGEVALTDQIFPAPSSTGVVVFAEGGAVRLRSLTVESIGEPAAHVATGRVERGHASSS